MFNLVATGRDDQAFRTYDSAERWAKGNLPDGTWRIEPLNTGCC